MDELNQGKVNKFLERTGRRGATILSILGKNAQFIKAISTPLGEELLRDMIVMMEEKLELIYNEKASEDDKADFRSLKRISNIWISRINKYKALSDDIKTS